MLVLSRKVGETIVVNGGQIVITIVAIQGNKARVGVVAPDDVEIHRLEVFQQAHPEAAAAALQLEHAR